MNILLVDTTFLGKAPNREKTLAHIKHWRAQHAAAVTIYTTRFGIDFYSERLAGAKGPEVRFIRIPFSTDYETIALLKVPFEYLKRIVGGFVADIPKDIDVSYSICSIIVDVLSALVIRARRKSLRAFCVFDNFVPPPSQRPGRYVLKLIPYLASRITLRFLGRMDGVFSALTDSNHVKLLRLMEGRCRVVQTPNGLDLDRIERAQAPVNKRYDLVFMGRQHAAKGIFDLIDLAARVKEVKKDVRLLLIGPDEPSTKGEIQRRVKASGLQDNITHAGFVSQEEKYRLLKDSKIFAFLSYDESFPISFLEAIACNLPVIAYDLDVYKDPPYCEAYSQFFKKGDVDAAAAYALSVLTDYDPVQRKIEGFYAQKRLIRSLDEIAEVEYEAFSSAVRSN